MCSIKVVANRVPKNKNIYFKRLKRNVVFLIPKSRTSPNVSSSDFQWQLKIVSRTNPKVLLREIQRISRQSKNRVYYMVQI